MWLLIMGINLVITAKYILQTARHPMLLLVGPPGCGKTATIHTLAREMGCAILEWVNPVSDVGGSGAGTVYIITDTPTATCTCVSIYM